MFHFYKEEVRKLTLFKEKFLNDLFIDQSPPDYATLRNFTRSKEDAQKYALFLQSDIDDFKNDYVHAENSFWILLRMMSLILIRV